MKRKTTDTPCKIYSYGIKLTKEAEAQLDEHLRLADDYYNGLVFIENERRTAYRNARAEAVPAYAEAEDEARGLDEKLLRVRCDINRHKAASRTDSAPADLVEEARELKSRLADAWRRLSDLRKEANAHPDVRATSERINSLLRGEVIQRELKIKRGEGLLKNYERHHPLFWTTMGRTRVAFKQASQGSRFMVRRRFFDGTGSVGGQIQAQPGLCGFLRPEALFAARSQFLQLSPLPDDQWDTARGRRKAYSQGRLRIGSVGIKPVWLEFSALIHRPLPEGALIKNAWVLVERSGNRRSFKLQVTVETEAFRQVAYCGPTVAVSFGCRRLPNGDVHVATAMHADTSRVDWKREMILPADVFRRLNYCEETLRSAASIHFDAARAALADYVDCNEAPDWMHEEMRHHDKWRSPKRLARIARRFASETLDAQQAWELWDAWKSERLADGLDLFAPFEEVESWCSDADLTEAEVLAAYLEFWRKKNAHLYQWDCDQRRRAAAYRNDLFGQWASQFNGRRVVVDGSDLAAQLRRAEAEEENTPDAFRRLRKNAAPGKLAERFGAERIKVKAPEDLEGCDKMAARCVALLDAAGEDTAAIREIVLEQRRVLSELRDAAE